MSEKQPVRYELIDKNGEKYGPFDTQIFAAIFAEQLFPDQHQDEDRTGAGWDIQIQGAK